jgi:predicted metal-dependent phosphoesterase TrpH
MIDLHVHSTYSDGTLSPEKLIALAEQIGLEAVALCDHNTVAGLPDFLAAAAGKKLQAVPGVEFSTDYQGTELHILGLFIEPEHYAAVTDKVNWMLIQKEQSNRDLVEALKPAGILLDYEAIRARTPNGQVNRAVIAAEMVRRGYCESVQDCFKQWLSPKRGYFKPPARLDVFDVIRFIKSIGAVAVLAHPFLNLDEAGLEQFLTEAVPCGLDAMEVYYPKFTPEQETCACHLAERFGIAFSGGSDFHGENKPDTRMGTGRGTLCVPYSILQEIISRKIAK